MEQDENTQDVQLEQQENEAEGIEGAEAEETTEEPQSGDPETVPEEQSIEDQLAKAKAEAAKYKRLFAKTQKKPAAQPSADKPKASSAPSSPALSSEEMDVRILKANGTSDELIEQLRKIAHLNGTDLLSAQSDPIYQGIKEKHEQQIQQRKAGLGASRGGSSVKPKKDFTTPGLSDEEHRKMWEESR